ncbi:MAG TPA: hypothetical protein VMU81_12170 [Acetobacteraceae bacterium]|nr:hypothetical protein [Acetobacteraceae bacterium]
MLDAIVAPQTDTGLFCPIRLGRYLLANRIAMAPLTRSRASADGTPVPLMAEYYAQRASAGLIVAEGTNISPQGRGYAFTPGIYNATQVEAWQPITRAVHNLGGHIFVQLWHVGRISHIRRCSPMVLCLWRHRPSALISSPTLSRVSNPA